ncbi:MAG: restriction endonuclease subunit S [Leptospirales bacterium]
MNAERLLQHFERISEAPDAVPRLRRFILDLAVRGKLVEQDPNDEAAEELLRRIQEEKVRRIVVGEIRPPRSLEWTDEIEKMFSLPNAWAWIRLADVGAVIGGGTPSSGDPDNFTDGGAGIAWLTPADLGKHDDLYVSHGARDLTEKGLQSSSATVMPKNSVLFTSRAPIGYTAIASNEISTNQGFKSVVPYIVECSRYIAVYLQAFGPWIDSQASGTTFREVSGKIVSGLPFPLPPLAEQHRIVAKVDELMALCEELEAAKQRREQSRDRMVAATLHNLNNGSASPEPGRPTFEESARFYFKHLPRLTTRLEHIKQLRQTILNLAVRGKLVEQDPNDEPAEELLKRIQAEKALNDNKAKELTLVTEDEMPFGVPGGWKWVRIRQISTAHGQTIPKADFTYIDVTAIDKERGCIGNPTVLSASEAPSRARKVVQKGDVIYSCVRPYLLNIAIIDTEITPQPIASTAFAVLNGFDLTLPQYLWTALRSPFMVESVESRMRGQAYPAINDSDFALLPIPLPPLAEQHRIVAKVDELMAVCNELEIRLATTSATHKKLLEATLQEALNGYSELLKVRCKWLKTK